jgi:NAD(P) transhydrogenase subunit beta
MSSSLLNANVTALLYLVAGVLFILALRGLSSPESSRRGNMLGIIGMVIAVGTTLASHPPAGFGAWILVIAGLGLGGGIGAVIARRVPMTSMPELVAAFHSLVGMAAVLVAAGAFYAPTAFGIGTHGHIHTQSLIEMSIGVAIGAITFTGSVIVVGALLAVGVELVTNDQGRIWARALGFVALVFASINIFGGFLVTSRMLAMYQKKK